MSVRSGKSKTNRYKKSGKGATTLAVFLVAVMIMLVGAYYFFSWQYDSGEKPVKPVSAILPPTQTVHTRISSSSSQPAVAQQPVPKEPGPKWEHYTDDTKPPETSVKALPEQKSQAGKAELAIIIDDMGSSMNEARELAAISVPVTFAIIPGLRHDRDVAELAQASGIELMVHIPMQSKEYPKRRLEQNGLLLSHEDEEIARRVEEYLKNIPKSVGANNHTGSAFTEDAGKMRVVLGILKQRGMFYIDSITTPSTVGPAIAREIKMRSGKRDVFLDNEQDENYIRGQLSKAVERSRKTGRAIAICHPHPVTIATLQKTLPGLKQSGITLVYASRVVR